MPEYKTITVKESIRLDLILVKEWEHLTREQIQQMVISGHIRIKNSRARKVAQMLHPGDKVEVILPVPKKQDDVIVDRTVPIVFEDEHIVVVDKEAGLALRKSSRIQQATLASTLSYQRPELVNVGGVGHAGLVTALEESVSGLVLLAKNDEIYRELKRNLKRQRIEVTYTAMVEGRLRGEGVIEEPIGNARHERERLQVSREGRPAVTLYRTQRHFKEAGQDYTLLAVTPTTSRRHQIRIHLAWYGFPLVGDKLYGSRFQKLLSDRIFLHLGVMEFSHPFSGDIVHVESPLPVELQSILTYLIRPGI
jgi:23S rRNA pseudouridine1911/1915/1917 synthase